MLVHNCVLNALSSWMGCEQFEKVCTICKGSAFYALSRDVLLSPSKYTLPTRIVNTSNLNDVLLSGTTIPMMSDWKENNPPECQDNAFLNYGQLQL